MSTQYIQLGNTITGEQNGDYLGMSIDTNNDGSRIVIGAPYKSNETTYDIGYVKIYEWNGINWIQLGSTLIGESKDDKYGWSVAMNGDGNKIIIGAPAYDISINNTYDDEGYVQVYNWNGTSWQQLGNNLYGSEINDNFGWSVNINYNGNIIVVGSIGFNNLRGKVSVYQVVSNNWTQVGNSFIGIVPYSISPLNMIQGDYYGYSVSINNTGNIIAFSSLYDDKNSEVQDTGVVYIYKLNALSEWEIYGNKIFGEESNNSFGYSICLDGTGNNIVIGSPFNNGGDDRFGATYVYYYSSGNWIKQTKINGFERNSEFGRSVSMSSDALKIIIGASRESLNAPGTNSSEYNYGHARVYTFINNTWSLFQDLVGYDDHRFFGHTVNISKNGNIISSSEPWYNLEPINNGRVYIYELGTIEEETYTIPEYNEDSTYTTYSYVNINLSKNDLNQKFKFSSNATNIDNISLDEIQCWISDTSCFNNLILANSQVTSHQIDTTTIDTIENDYIKYLAFTLLKNYRAVDLFNNETSFKNTLLTECTNVIKSNIQSKLALAGTLNNKLLTSSNDPNNIVAKLLHILLIDDIERLKNEFGSGTVNLTDAYIPFNIGDTITMVLTINPNENQVNVLGSGSIVSNINSKNYTIQITLV